MGSSLSREKYESLKMNESGGPKKDKDEKFYTKNEILKHNSKDSLWIIFDGKICDLTEYLDSHPGGSALLRYAGKVGGM
uniref:Cytochrome b5 heme-binding domain-containing protein n=1 Tax=Panagrolaimus superbus TaxID=310955 RepID=A0A914XUY6_9BILA